jgi:4-amino-4-deoxy-L-arabinose transferase-like glycosyltransferase
MIPQQERQRQSPDAPSGSRGVTAMTGLAARHEWLVLGMVWVASAIYVGACLKRGWVPCDAGMLAQGAERVLRGQVPFRDFGEVYTGGLPYLNALAFRLFGANLFSIRIPLFVLFLGWVPAVYFIARRFAGPLAAGLVTLLAVAWSLPNYTEAMPSWYNLFFATFGAAALLRYIDTRRQRWLWIAGLCGGLSIVTKITGLYFIAAGLLFFAFRERSLTSQSVPARRGWFYRLFLVVCLLLYLAMLLDTVWQHPNSAEFTHFVLPGACLAALLLWREYRQAPGAAGARFRNIFSMALPFLAGAGLLLWYARAGAIHDFFVYTALGMRHIQWAFSKPIGALGVLGLAPALIVFLLACSRDESLRRLADWAAPVILGVTLLAAWKSFAVYELIGFSAPLAIPLLALAALAWLRPSLALPPAKSDPVFLLVAVSVLRALIQFPLPQPLFFNYVAPFVILALLALASLRRRSPHGKAAMATVGLFYLVFALWLFPPGRLTTNEIGPQLGWRMEKLPFARAGGIRVAAPEEEEYAKLIPLIRAHARGDYIYAAPDCPEVYFLSGFRNPTKTFLEFLDPDFLDVPARTERVLRAIRDHNVNVVVILTKPQFSGPLPAGLRAALDAQFPRSAHAVQFEVRWRP